MSQYSPDFNQRQFPRLDGGLKEKPTEYGGSPSNLYGMVADEYPTRGVEENYSFSEHGDTTRLVDDSPEEPERGETQSEQASESKSESRSGGRSGGRSSSQSGKRSSGRKSSARSANPGASGGANAASGAMQASVSTIQAAVSTVAAVTVATVYVVMLNIGVVPDTPLANALSFSTSVNNPDGITLQATLYSDAGAVVDTLEFVDLPYLRFDGLTENTEYTLVVANPETGEELYRKSYCTAAEDPYRAEVSRAGVSNGALSFSVEVDGLERSGFYTVSVTSSDGRSVYATDSADPTLSVSVPVGEDVAEAYYIRVNVNGAVFQYEVQGGKALQKSDDAPDEGEEPLQDSEDAEDASPEDIENTEDTGETEDIGDTEEIPSDETPAEDAEPDETPSQETKPDETKPDNGASGNDSDDGASQDDASRGNSSGRRTSGNSSSRSGSFGNSASGSGSFSSLMPAGVTPTDVAAEITQPEESAEEAQEETPGEETTEEEEATEEEETPEEEEVTEEEETPEEEATEEEETPEAEETAQEAQEETPGEESPEGEASAAEETAQGETPTAEGASAQESQPGVTQSQTTKPQSNSNLNASRTRNNNNSSSHSSASSASNSDSGDNSDSGAEQDATIVWTWADNNASVTATLPDENGDSVTLPANVVEMRRAATCTEEGVIIRTAAVTAPDGETYSDTKTTVIPASGHYFVEIEGGTDTKTRYGCTRCGAEIRVEVLIEQET